MNALRIPLYGKFLLWAILNVVLICVCVYAYAPHDESGLNLLLTQSVRERLSAIAREIAGQLYEVDPAGWSAVLAKHQSVSGVVFTAQAIGGPPPDGKGPGFGPNPPGPPPDGRPPPDSDFRGPGFGPGPSHAIDIERSTGRIAYHVSIPVEEASRGGPPREYLIGADVANAGALLRLLGIGREVGFGIILLLVSALMWWPFIWRITHTIRNLSRATQLMSRGRLETRVIESRRDELGDLANAVNRMAERLEDIIAGQRQFIADVAHEVISPVARMQIGIGILEGRMGESAATALNDVREDLEQMAVMLNELLLFSRSGLETARAAPVAIELRPLLDRLVASESSEAVVQFELPPGLFVLGHGALLSRAIANLLRNALRYGGGANQPVEIAAFADKALAHITIRDRGPGVPDAALGRLGEPFFRPDLARTRASGGFGLGLAIVKRCIRACDGEVSFKNREGGGFEVQIDVPVATLRL